MPWEETQCVWKQQGDGVGDDKRRGLVYIEDATNRILFFLLVPESIYAGKGPEEKGPPQWGMIISQSIFPPVHQDLGQACICARHDFQVTEGLDSNCNGPHNNLLS